MLDDIYIKLTDGLFITLCHLQLSMSLNMPVQLVPCFVGLQHICVVTQSVWDLLLSRVGCV